jgi:ubiquinol-cytochrome c reductase cytochrome c subunit
MAHVGRARGGHHLRRAVAPLAAAVLATGAVLFAGAGSGSAAPTPHPPIAPSPAPGSATTPLPEPALAGRILFLRDCAWCHGSLGQGGDSGPNLQGVGAESADFMLSTGRMPIPMVETQPPRKPPHYTATQIDQLVAFVASLGPGPAIPRVDPGAGDIALGSDLYEENCAACHSSTGIGGALTSGLQAPPLVEAHPPVTARQVVEAMRLGGAGLRTGKMPRFGPESFDQRQTNSIVRYVLYLQHPEDRGGITLARIGPVAEGFVAWAGALFLLVLFIRWIGRREPGR